MKKIGFTALLTLFSMMNSLQSNAQDSTVIVILDQSLLTFTLEVVDPNNELTIQNFKSRNTSTFIELNKVLGNWINFGYSIVNSSSVGESDQDYKIIYVLLKEEE